MVNMIDRAQFGRSLVSFLQNYCNQQIQVVLCTLSKYLVIYDFLFALGVGCDMYYVWEEKSCYR